jgi:hypothetical protein
MAEYESDEDQKKLANVLGRYKSTKGDADKRKVTSQINVAKARAAKLAGLQASRKRVEIEESESEDDEEEENESESDGEELVIHKKKKPQKGRGRGGAPPASEDRLSRMEQIIMNLAMQKVKPKKKAPRKTVNIQIAPPNTPQSAPAAAVVNPQAKVMKQHIISWG